MRVSRFLRMRPRTVRMRSADPAGALTAETEHRAARICEYSAQCQEKTLIVVEEFGQSWPSSCKPSRGASHGLKPS
jgi:hypothetical protein